MIYIMGLLNLSFCTSPNLFLSLGLQRRPVCQFPQPDQVLAHDPCFLDQQHVIQAMDQKVKEKKKKKKAMLRKSLRHTNRPQCHLLITSYDPFTSFLLKTNLLETLKSQLESCQASHRV